MITLGNIANDLHDHFTGYEQAAATFLERHLPQIKAAAGDPIILALEDVYLPPDTRAVIAALIRQYGQPHGAESPQEPQSAPDGMTGGDQAAAAPSGGQEPMQADPEQAAGQEVPVTA